MATNPRTLLVLVLVLLLVLLLLLLLLLLLAAVAAAIPLVHHGGLRACWTFTDCDTPRSRNEWTSSDDTWHNLNNRDCPRKATPKIMAAGHGSRTGSEISSESIPGPKLQRLHQPALGHETRDLDHESPPAREGDERTAIVQPYVMIFYCARIAAC